MPSTQHPRSRFGLLFPLLLVPCGAAGCGQAVNSSPALPHASASAELPPSQLAAADPALSAASQSPPQTQPLTPLTPEELADGWIALFDGQTLFGWKAASDADWRAADGMISVSRGEKGLLCTTAQFSDYILKLDFRSAKGTNSGVFLHTPLKPTDPAVDCYELNIADSDNPFPTASFVKRQKAEGQFDSLDWQSFEVRVAGGRITVKLDGQTVLEYDDPAPLLRGHIGLQLNEGRVDFRNMKLKPLSLESIFNGRDLDGWKEYPDMASRFTVTDDGLLNVKNGRGQLETIASFGDFVLQLECQTHAPQLNSGIFYRCIPGQTMLGYECQIHNGFQNGDRRQPEDCGTGGIFRRQNARFVNADDQRWFSMTLIANGPHVAAWVDGVQVSDWTDERPAADNPREGRRLAAGTIMIQGHDPTTDISFRKLRAAELPPRRE
jgi:hypothetical protein